MLKWNIEKILVVLNQEDQIQDDNFISDLTQNLCYFDTTFECAYHAAGEVDRLVLFFNVYTTTSNNPKAEP